MRGGGGVGGGVWETERLGWQRRVTDGYVLKGNDTLSFRICSAVLPDRAVMNN